MSGPFIFRLPRSLVRGRLDPRSTSPLVQALIARLKNSRYPAVALHKLTNFRKQVVQDISPGTTYIGLENIEGIAGGYVPTSDKESISSAAVFKAGDVLFPKLRPYLNKTHHANFDGICSTEFHVLKIHGALPGYVAAILRSDSVVQLTTQWMTGNTLPRLQTADVQNLLIPLPPNDVQLKAVTIMQEALTTKKKLEKEASMLLSSVSSELLRQLAITAPKQITNTTHKKFFTTSCLNVCQNRWDAIFWDPRNVLYEEAIEQGSFQTRSLGLLCKFSTQQWNTYKEFQENVPYLEISAINPVTGKFAAPEMIPTSEAPSRAKMLVQTGDILISTTRPGRGAIGMAEQEHPSKFVASTGFAVIRDVNASVDRNYLYAMLRSEIALLQMTRRTSGGNYPAISQAQLEKIKIPLPPVETQREIVQALNVIRTQASKLQENANKAIQLATMQVEKLILGD